MTQQLPLLVMDKSFAQTIKAVVFTQLSEKFIVTVPTAFYHEVFDTETRKRLSTLVGFPEFRRIDIATYLRLETETGKPVCTADESDLPRLTFNPKVLSSAWELSAEESSVVQAHQKLVNDRIAFWESVIQAGVIGFSNEEMDAVKGTEHDFIHVCEQLRDINRIRRSAFEMGYVHAELLDPTWFHFRHFQAWLLQGLVLCRRYPKPAEPPNRVQLEHDVQDIEYLTVGLVTGHLATAEVSRKFAKAPMGWRFKLLLPEGHLWTPDMFSV